MSRQHLICIAMTLLGPLGIGIQFNTGSNVTNVHVHRSETAIECSCLFALGQQFTNSDVVAFVKRSVN